MTLNMKVQNLVHSTINMALQIVQILCEWLLKETAICNAYTKSLLYWSCAFIKIFLLTLTINNLITSEIRKV